jgi:hypothetical protein
MIRRREFIVGLGGAAAWPLAARAQQGERMRRIGVLVPGDETDPVRKTYVSAFMQALAGSGWTDGRNVRMDLRWAGADTNRIRALAQELACLQPDIVATGGVPATVAVQRETRTIPIVFGIVADPVASGLVAALNRPGGNITGFTELEPSFVGKWLELLSEIAPGLKRAAIMFNPEQHMYSAAAGLCRFSNRRQSRPQCQDFSKPLGSNCIQESQAASRSRTALDRSQGRAASAHRLSRRRPPGGAGAELPIKIKSAPVARAAMGYTYYGR